MPAYFILLTSWDTLVSVDREKFPVFLVSIALKDRCDSIATLRACNKRVAITGAERDEMIPVLHARTLYDSCAGQKRMWIIPQAGHNDRPLFMDIGRIRDIMNFPNGM